MKLLLLAITTLLTSAYVNAQSDEGLFEVEYEMNGQELKSFAFSTDNCAQNLIVKSWENWVTNKEGSSACVRNELRLANENMIRLTKENADAQLKKGNSIKSYLKNNNTLLKLESKKQALGDKLDLVVNQLERESNDKVTDGLMKKKIKTENSLRSIEDQVVTLSGKIQTAEENDKGLDAKINQLTSQIQQQRSITENLKKKYSSIAR